MSQKIVVETTEQGISVDLKGVTPLTAIRVLLRAIDAIIDGESGGDGTQKTEGIRFPEEEDPDDAAGFMSKGNQTGQ